MCRLVYFKGNCTHCGVSHIWNEMTQHLECLEAKNNDGFNSCQRGVEEDKCTFSQVCDDCSDGDEYYGVQFYDIRGCPMYDDIDEDEREAMDWVNEDETFQRKRARLV